MQAQNNNFLSLNKLCIGILSLILVTSFAPNESRINLKNAIKAEAKPELQLSSEQVANANIIIGTGKALPNVNDQDIIVALMTAMQEATMKNLDHGDDWWFAQWGEKSDSLGIFQQRDSWGTKECRLQVTCASQLFYNALVKIPNRDSIDKGDLAQKVQVSAFPDHYDKWEDTAEKLLSDWNRQFNNINPNAAQSKPTPNPGKEE